MKKKWRCPEPLSGKTLFDDWFYYRDSLERRKTLQSVDVIEVSLFAKWWTFIMVRW